MYNALQSVDRDIVYSISNSAPLTLAADLMKYAQLWRTTGDIRDTWKSVSDIAFNRQDVWAGYRRPGAWPDADMMVLGCVGWGKYEHPINPTNLTPDEQYSHMTMWCMMNSPLMLGMDLRKVNKGDNIYNIIANKELIALNQDKLGIQAKRVYCSIAESDPDKIYITNNDRIDILAKPLADGDFALSFIIKLLSSLTYEI